MSAASGKPTLLGVLYTGGVTLGAVVLIGCLAFGWGTSWTVPALGVLLLLASATGLLLLLMKSAESTRGSTSGAEAVGGLITQRMAAERGRLEAINYIVLGAVMFSLAVLREAPSDFAQWVYAGVTVVCGIFLIAWGVRTLRARRKRIADFEAQYGVDAGRQVPVTREKNRRGRGDPGDG